MSPTNDFLLLGRVLISAWILYGVLRYGRSIEPAARRVRWAIVGTGVLAIVIVLSFYPRAFGFAFIWLVWVPTALFFLLPDLAVQLVRALGAIRRRFKTRERPI